MVEFADMQCPNCAFFAQGTERRLTEKYIATGKVRLESKHFAFLGQESVRAAQAVECANEQGKFWEYRDAVYAAQKGENRGTFSDTKLKQIAAEVGANSEALGACLSSGRTADQVNRDLQEGKKMGVTGTPTFFINGRMIVGAQPDAAFESAIEQALAAGGAR
ncbi:MAG: thioredoxin domain-containing protein [Dehalococcoidia bacterium]